MKADGMAKIFVALMLFSMFIQRNYAQTTYATITGTVRDASGAVIPGVIVTIINENTGEKHSQPTGDLGAYTFTNLFPGVYSIHAELAGFRPVDIRGVRVQVNQTARFDLTMEIGEITEKIEIVASAPVLATDTSDVGQVISNRQIVDLPLNGRNFVQLAALTHGVILTGTTESGGPNFIAQGGRPTQNSYLIEGVETRIQREGRYGLNLSIEAIQEFKVMQNSFEAEYGRGTTIINAAIKSGGNEVHGSIFEFLRNDVLDARNAFDVTGIKPPLRMNQFGASVGGPIRRDKTFYFVNYEGQRVRRGSTRFTNVPTPAMLDGDLSGMRVAVDPLTGEPFPNNRIPASRISQFAKAAKPYYPAPNSAALPGVNYVAVLSNPTNMNQVTARIDHTLSLNDRISGHLTIFNYETINLGTLPFSGVRGYSKVRPNISIQHTHTFNPRLLNDFRFGYVRTDTFNGPDKLLDRDVTPEFGLKNLTPEPKSFTPPQIRIDGFGSVGGGPWMPNGALDVNRQIAEQLTYVTGRHSIKVGADLRWFRYLDLGYATQNGYYVFTNRMYTGNAMADFLLGLPQEAFANQKGGQSFSMDTRNGEFSLYAQDNIKLTRSLTLNAGLRYEYVQWPLEKNDELATWNFQKGFLDFAGKDIPRRIVPPDRNNWGPRLGLAYSPAKKTVIRAGSGVMYGNFRQWEIALLHFNPPFVYDNFFFNDLPRPRFTTDTLWPPVPKTLEGFDFTRVTVNYQSPDKVLPVMYQWNLNVQRELLPNLLFEVGYVGNRSLRQPNRWDANAARPIEDLSNPTPIQSRRPYQNVGFVSGNTSRAWGNYNALTVRLERRYSDGLTLLGTYTWSKAMGIRPWDNWTVMDINNIRFNYGPMPWDYTHRAVISYVWELPFGPGKRLLGGTHGILGQLIGGWQLNGITTFSSGAALSLNSPVSNGLGNRAGNKPDRLADGNLPPSERKIERWFDTSAFKDPPFGRYGNSGEGIIEGPGLVNWDISLFKNIRVAESKTVQFRLEMFNAFNNVNLNNPSTSTGDPRFGRITGAGFAREVQFGLKFIF